MQRLETGVVARGAFYYRAEATSGDGNDAEWLAALDALHIALELGATDVTLIGDSALVVNQINGTGRCRDERFRQALTNFQALGRQVGRVRARHVPRHRNLAGIALQQMRSGLPRPFIARTGLLI